MVSRSALIFLAASVTLTLVLGLIVPLITGDPEVVHRTALMAHESMIFVLDLIKAVTIFIMVATTHVLEIIDNLLRGADNFATGGRIQVFFGINPLGRSYYVSVRELIIDGAPDGFDPLYRFVAVITDESLYSSPAVTSDEPLTLIQRVIALGLDLLSFLGYIIQNAITVIINLAGSSTDKR